jgi:hypothetical protein
MGTYRALALKNKHLSPINSTSYALHRTIEWEQFAKQNK